MAELRTMAQDITKNTGDIENYTKEFVELQSQLSQIRNEKIQRNQFICNKPLPPQIVCKGTGSYINESGASLDRPLLSVEH